MKIYADIVYKGNEYELTDSVMVSMECIGAVALSLLFREGVEKVIEA